MADSTAPTARRRIVLVKGTHRWVFQWEDGDAQTIVQHAGDLADRDDVDFDWFDAAVVCRQVGASVMAAVPSDDEEPPPPADSA